MLCCAVLWTELTRAGLQSVGGPACRLAASTDVLLAPPTHAAFLASRNKPSVDKQLFAGGSGWRGGKRRRNVLAADRQVCVAGAPARGRRGWLVL